MSFQIKQIDGAVVEKKRIKESSAVYMPFEDIGFNKAIDAQSQVRLELKRDKLAELIYMRDADGTYIDFNRQNQIISGHYYRLADVLISAIDKNPSNYIGIAKL